MEVVINGHTDTFLTFSHAECSAKFHLVAKVVLGDKLLQFFDDLT